MEVHGAIWRSAELPELRLDEWITLSHSHPNLREIPSKVVPNPFKKGELMTVKPPTGTVAIAIDNQQVGSMYWNYEIAQIVVVGSDARVLSVAIDVAQHLSAIYDVHTS